jgi:NAD(P)-dependent dehydrogenase (short-subunit alcohol dehydrogenase family)
MADERVWFITGAGRGMGVDIAQAALAAGHAVVATGRNTEAVADVVGEADELLIVAEAVAASDPWGGSDDPQSRDVGATDRRAARPNPFLYPTALPDAGKRPKVVVSLDSLRR